MPERVSLGDGRVDLAELGRIGSGSVLEPGVRVFCPERVFLGGDVYVGHDCFLRAYPEEVCPEGVLRIGDGCWIGPQCFINSFGGVTLGRKVGVGPGVRIISSTHIASPANETPAGGAIVDRPLQARPVVIEDGADIGAGAVVLPGVIIGCSAQVGAGAVVTRSVAPRAVVAGVPAKLIAGSLTEESESGDLG